MKTESYNIMSDLEEFHWWFIARKKIIHSILKKFLKNADKNIKVLDIGCGTGKNIEFFGQFYNNISGLDQNSTAVELAAKKTGRPIYQGELPNNIRLDHHSFNLIFLFDVLEHIDDDIGALKEIHNLLMQNGRAIITVPAYEFLRGVHDDFYGHKRRYTIKELRQKLEKVGLTVEFISYFNTFLFPLILIMRILKNKKFALLKDVDDFSINNSFLNFILTIIMSNESFWLKFLRFPYGTSIIAECKTNYKDSDS